MFVYTTENNLNSIAKWGALRVSFEKIKEKYVISMRDVISTNYRMVEPGKPGKPKVSVCPLQTHPKTMAAV